jgi:chromate transporter
MRRSARLGRFLDGVNVASFGLMAAVTWQLARSAVVDPLTLGVASVSLLLLIRYQPNSTWLVAAGAIIGLLKAALR